MQEKRLKLAFGNHKLLWNDKDALSVYSRKSGNTVLTDRFGHLNRFSPWNVVEQNSEFPRKDYTETLSDIIYKRGTELVDLTRRNNKKLYLTWSGGVDSTALVLSILHAAEGKYDDIKIIFTESSIDEYPKFYEYLTKISNLEMIKKAANYVAFYWNEVAKNDLLVTGMPADQLFGSIVGQDENLKHSSDWRDFVEIDKAIGQFEEAFQYYGMPIKTLGEFLWFMNFSAKWTEVSNLIPWICGLEKGNSISFFGTKEFQDWSVSNFDRLHIYDQKDKYHYKREMKEFINSLFRDDDYQYKGKTGSIGYSVQFEYRGTNSYKRKPFVSILGENDVLYTRFHSEYLPDEMCKKVEDSMMNRELSKYRKKIN